MNLLVSSWIFKKSVAVDFGPVHLKEGLEFCEDHISSLKKNSVPCCLLAASDKYEQYLRLCRPDQHRKHRKATWETTGKIRRTVTRERETSPLHCSWTFVRLPTGGRSVVWHFVWVSGCRETSGRKHQVTRGSAGRRRYKKSTGVTSHEKLNYSRFCCHACLITLELAITQFLYRCTLFV